ncbi:MAG: glycosyltransferase family 4 protein [Bacteroidia bacterium]|nr:glycosyltransferase family 4 protein [Bacteroidia bacterium]
MLRVIYVHGRPAPHPNRYRILQAISSEFLPADFWLPWMEQSTPSLWRKAVSLIGCTLKFPQRRQWHLLIGDGPQPLLPLLRLTGRLSRTQLIIPYMAGEYAYFVAIGYYGRFRTAFHKRFFRLWDAYLSISPMITRLIKSILPYSWHSRILEIRNFFRLERLPLVEVKPEVGGQTILFIGEGGGAPFRVYYKGLDLLLATMEILLKTLPNVRCIIAGEWSDSIRRELANRYPNACSIAQWVGRVNDLKPLLASASLGVVCGRGDAFPNTLLEMGLAGLPVLVSEWTGGAHIVEEIAPEMVAPLEAWEIAEKIRAYLSYPLSKKREMGSLLRQKVLNEYNEVVARRILREKLSEFLQHTSLRGIGLPSWEEASETIQLLRRYGAAGL